MANDISTIELAPLLDDTEKSPNCPYGEQSQRTEYYDSEYEFFDMCFVFPISNKRISASVTKLTQQEKPRITQEHMQQIANTIIVPRDKTRGGKENEEGTQRAHIHGHRFREQEAWAEGMTREDFLDSIQKSFISYLKTRKCHIQKDTKGNHVFYKVRMKEAALQAFAQKTRYVLQLDRTTAEKYANIKNTEDSGLPFVPPYLEFDMDIEGKRGEKPPPHSPVRFDASPRSSPSSGYQSHSEYSHSPREDSGRRRDISPQVSPRSKTALSHSTKFSLRTSPVHSSRRSFRSKSLIWQRYNITGAKVEVTLDTKDNKKYSIFRPVDRIRLLNICIARLFRLDQMVSHGIMETYYVLHQLPTRNLLSKNWGQWNNIVNLHKQPIADIREYFGENITFYFAWVGFFTQKIFMPGIIGLFVFLIQLWYDPRGQFNDKVSNIASIAYSVFIICWAPLYITEWDKVENVYRIEWGVETSFRKLKTESVRFISGVNQRLFRFSQWRRRITSSFVSFLFVGFVLSIVSLVFSIPFFIQQYPRYFRWLSPDDVPKYISVINVIFISIFDLLWCKLAYILTNYENWRYEEDFQQSLIFKMFVFRCINYFNSFFYLAFVKENLSPCLPDGSCVGLLKWNLGMIFLTNFLFNFVEIGKPYLLYIISRLKVLRQGQEFTSELLVESRASSSIYASDVENDDFGLRKGSLGSDSDGLQKLQYVAVSLQAHSPAETRGSDQNLEGSKAVTMTSVVDSERDFIMASYDAVYGILEDYMEIVLEFGFCTLFSLILPMVPFLAYISNIFEIRSDAYKLLHLHRRAYPTTSYGLGPWRDMLRYTCYISVAITIAMSVFTIGLSKLTHLTLTAKLVIFMVTEHLSFLAPLCYQFLTPDDTREIERLRESMNQVLQKTLWTDEMEEVDSEGAYEEIPSSVKAVLGTALRRTSY